MPTLKKYQGREGTGEFRPLTLEEAKQLHAGQHVWFTRGADARRAKVNGAPKTWKRDAGRVAIPAKYGMYEYGIFTEDDIKNGVVLVELHGEDTDEMVVLEKVGA